MSSWPPWSSQHSSNECAQQRKCTIVGNKQLQKNRTWQLWTSSESYKPKKFSRCCNKVEGKYIQEQQPNQIHCYIQNMRFINRMDQSMANYRTGIQVKKWWWSPFVWMVNVALQFVRVLNRINKDVGDESVFSGFLKTYCQCNFSEIFKGRQIILEPCRKSKYPIRCLLWCHKTLPGAIWTQGYSQPL